MKLTVAALDLVLGNDNLHTVCIIGSRDRVLEETDRTDDFVALEHADLAAILREEVGRIADLI